MSTPGRSVLSDYLLERCAQRAAAYDRENRFFFEDFEELREAKFLLSAVPKEFGGLGLTLAEICQEQRRLARRSAPTALATNMHLLATGIAADLWRKGDKSQVWMLEEAARGAIFAYGYSESGNDLEVLYAAGKAERVDGGYRFFGHKHFGSLTPVSIVEPTPLMVIRLAPACSPKIKLGTACEIFSTDVRPRPSNSAPLSAVTDAGIFCTFSPRLVAVTIISPKSDCT